MSREERLELDQPRTDDGVLTDNDETELDMLAEMNASEADISYHYTVHRVTMAMKDGLKEPFLFEGDGRQVEEIRTKLLEDFGTGTYRIRIFKNKRLWRRFDVSIEVPSKREQPKNDLSGMDKLATAIIEQGRENRALIEKLISERNQPSNVIQLDPISMMEKLSIVMKNMTPAIPQMGGGIQVKDMIDVFKSGLQMASDARGDGDEGIMGLAKEFLKSPMFSALATMAAPKPPVSANPQLAGIEAPAPQIPANPSGENELAQILIEQLNYLVGKAQANANPDLYAEVMLDDFPSELLERLLNTPDILRQLAMLNPQVNQYQNWFNRLLASMKEQALRSPQAGASLFGRDTNVPHDDTGRGGGNARDAQAHAVNRPNLQEKP